MNCQFVLQVSTREQVDTSLMSTSSSKQDDETAPWNDDHHSEVPPTLDRFVPATVLLPLMLFFQASSCL
jgi:hypothetical protein